MLLDDSKAVRFRISPSYPTNFFISCSFSCSVGMFRTHTKSRTVYARQRKSKEYGKELSDMNIVQVVSL